MNEDENTLYQKLQNATKVMLSGKFIMIDTHNKKKHMAVSFQCMTKSTTNKKKKKKTNTFTKKQKLHIKKLRKYRLIPKLAEEKK